MEYHNQELEKLSLFPFASIGRTLRHEYPEWNIKIFHVFPTSNFLLTYASFLFGEIFAVDELEGTWEFSFNEGKKFVAEIRIVSEVNMGSGNIQSLIRKDCSYVISGGLGAIGLSIAKSLLENNAEHIFLLSRSRNPKTNQEISLFSSLQKNYGTKLQVEACDVSNATQLMQTLSDIHKQFPIRGIHHAAGILKDGLIPKQTIENFVLSFAPKADGTGTFILPFLHLI